MSYRIMRMIVMFDLPTETSNDLRAYRNFRKFLIANGFFMYQYSIYSKIVLNHSLKKYYTNLLKNNAPKNGKVSVLSVTEKQYNDIEYITGELESDIITTIERNIFL